MMPQGHKGSKATLASPNQPFSSKFYHHLFETQGKILRNEAYTVCHLYLHPSNIKTLPYLYSRGHQLHSHSIFPSLKMLLDTYIRLLSINTLSLSVHYLLLLLQLSWGLLWAMHLSYCTPLETMISWLSNNTSVHAQGGAKWNNYGFIVLLLFNKYNLSQS